MTLRYPTPDRLWTVMFTTGVVVDFIAPYDSSEVRGWILEECYPGDKKVGIAGLVEVPASVQLELTPADPVDDVASSGFL